MLKRFRNVFSLSYQRYLDIALAEAQAREAKIEAALERVRSRTMGMQKSEELKDVIQVVYEQFVHLNIGVEHTGFIMDYKERYDMHIWLADPNKVPFQITIPYFDSPHWNSFIEAKDKGLDFFANHLSFEEKNKFYQDLFKLFHVPDKAKEYYFSCPGLAISTVLLENVGLYIENFSGTPYSDEENATLMRFGKVFQQTYTRFLDLQKAEAQAREAQIEAALERIRSAAMAMRDSSELSELIYKLYGELTKLDAKLDRCFIMIVNSENRGITWWLAGKEGLLAENGFFIQMNQHPSHLMYLECWEKRKKKWQYLFEGKEKRDWDSFGFSNTELARLPEFIKKDMAGVKKIHLSGSSDQFGSLVTGSLEPLPEEQQDIISRFTIAFNQAFIRFLDLEKAEAQTREAQIEAALERVRATSLAMHHTSELQGVVDSLSRQFQNLDIDANGGAFITINKEVEKDLPIWGSSGAANYIQKVTIPFLDKPIFTQLRDAIKNRNDFLVEEYTHTEKIEFFQHLFNHSPWNLLPPKRKKELLSREGGYIRSLTVSRYTSIFIINHNGKKFSESDNDILKRFGKVFEQSYTRFLDLQKAEAQNKIIQADNERKTKELEEARQLQLSLLPKELPKLPNLDIAVYVKTATEVGGDYYDFNVDDDGTLTAVIGDATGHGMKAGTIVSMIKALFASGGSHLDIKTFFNQSSAALKGIELGRLMMAFIMLKIKANKLVFANAGMPSLFIYRNKTREVEETMLHGMPLGAMKNFPYEIKETEISSGDTILLLSDGLPELKNEKNEQYDYERVKEEFNLAADKSPNDIVEYMKSSASKWSNGIESDDDVTFVVIKVK